MEAKQWTVQIFINESGDHTSARAVLTTRAGGHVTGAGHARRNPSDEPVAEIGDKLAAARALADLAQRLEAATSRDIASFAEQGSHGWSW